MIFRNKNPAGKHWNFLLGIAEIFDGLVRIISLGYLSTSAPLKVSRSQALVAINQMKRLRGKKTMQEGGNP